MTFRDEDKDWASLLRPLGAARKFAAGDLILSQGESARHVGLITAGRASARINTERGDETWVASFETDDFFGHTAWLADTGIDFELRADEDVTVLLIPIHKLDAFLASDHTLSVTLARDLADRLSLVTNRLVEAVTLSSPGRVCAELLRLALPVGIDPETLIIRPTPVFVELALRINSTRETVSRTISQLQKSGILSRQPGALLIHKPDALQGRKK